MDGWFWILATLATLLVVDLALNVLAIKHVLPIFERRPSFNVRPAAPDPSAEVVRIAGSDALRLVGSIHRPIGEPRGLIVFCPEFGGSHWSSLHYVGALVEEGFAVLAFDFRNQGDSDDQAGYTPTHWVTEREVSDALAVLRHAENLPEFAGLPLGLFGVSRGANAALAAAARSRRVRAVAVEGAFSTDAMMLHYAYRWAELYVPRWLVALLPEWHLARSMRLARRVNQLRHGVRYCVLERWLPLLADRPVLLVTGGKDSYVSPVIAERLREKIGSSCPPVWVVPGAKHNLARPTDPEGYDRRLVEFFSRIAEPVQRREPMVARELVPAGS